MEEIRVRDLQYQVSMPLPRPVLYCLKCGMTASASRGDYFNLSPDFVFTCCNQPMVLAIKKTVYQLVNE